MTGNYDFNLATAQAGHVKGHYNAFGWKFVAFNNIESVSTHQ